MVRNISVLEKETSKRIHTSRGLWKINTLKKQRRKMGSGRNGQEDLGFRTS